MIAIHDDMPLTRPADQKYGYRFGCDGLATRQEAAEFLGICVRAVDRRVKAGLLRKGKIGPASRICKRSLAEYANSIED